MFFLSVLRKEIPVEEWCKLLVISSKLDCKEVRARAIAELTAKKQTNNLLSTASNWETSTMFRSGFLEHMQTRSSERVT